MTQAKSIGGFPLPPPAEPPRLAPQFLPGASAARGIAFTRRREEGMQADATSALAHGPARATPPLLAVAGLVKSYGPIRAVNGLSFEVDRGAIVGLLGPNGAGKSTAMRVLVGYQVPHAGRIRIDGGDVFRAGAQAKRRLGYLPENPPLYPEMLVGEYLELVARLKGLRGTEARAALAGVRARLQLEGVWRRPTAQLSRGFRQRVGLAQAWIADPPLLVLDEPTTGLDPNQIADLRRLLAAWRSSKGILLSTHILAEARMLCDRVLVMSRGRLVAEGRPGDLAGHAPGPVATTVLVRGSQPDPLAGFAARERLTAHREGEQVQATGAAALWRLEGELDRGQRDRLVAHIAALGLELVEWSAGLSALERVFRRLTLEEGEEGAADDRVAPAGDRPSRPSPARNRGQTDG